MSSTAGKKDPDVPGSFYLSLIQEDGMKNTAFTWRIHSGEREKLVRLLDFIEHALDALEYNENSQMEISYLPTENLIRLMTLVPGQPPLTQILICEADGEIELA
jgi:hypothetical protein